MKKQYLHEGWTFTDSAFEGRMSAVVPGCLHTDLINAGLIENIYYGKNKCPVKYALVVLFYIQIA